MPFLLLVVDELERRNLPGEFALLPYVESHYRPLPAKGLGPAGMWQLMGRTATGQGLQVSKYFDQRLDAVASTRVALDLVERYDREFGDWRLAIMAFNAGEFRLKRLLGNQAATKWNARELGQLKLSPTTHQHLNRLLALSCIVEQPENFGVSLPAPARDDFLEHLKLNSPMDLRLAANLLGMPLTDLRRLNAAWRPGHEPAEPVASLLVPVTHVARFKEVLDLLPADRRAFWREQRVRQGDTLVSLASAVDLPADVLAIANGIAPHTELTAERGFSCPPPALRWALTRRRISSSKVTRFPQSHIVMA